MCYRTGRTSLDCDFDFSGLPEIENTFIYIGVNNLKTNAKDIEKIKIPGKGILSNVPEILYKLGNISFDGKLHRIYNRFCYIWKAQN